MRSDRPRDSAAALLAAYADTAGPDDAANPEATISSTVGGSAGYCSPWLRGGGLGDSQASSRASGGVYAKRYTRDMAKVVPVREFRTRLSELLGDVADRRDHVLVTRNGKPAAALVPIDEYEALEETAEILSDSATLSALEAGLADLARGDSVTLDELRQELAQRRAAR